MRRRRQVTFRQIITGRFRDLTRNGKRVIEGGAEQTDMFGGRRAAARRAYRERLRAS